MLLIILNVTQLIILMSQYSKGKGSHSRHDAGIQKKRAKKKKKAEFAPTVEIEPPFGEVPEIKPLGFFSRMSEDQIVKYAQKYVDSWELHSKEEFQVQYWAMYLFLTQRKLMDKIKFKK